MGERIDTASMVRGNELYSKIDELEKKFYDTIEEKKIEINSISDVERVERFFNPILKELIKLINSSTQLQKPLIALVRSRIVMDFHGRFAEKYNLNMMQVVEKLGQYNVNIVKEAMQDLKKLM